MVAFPIKLFQLIFYCRNPIIMSRDINLILPSDTQLGALYISDIRTAQCPSLLKQYRIGAIVAVIRHNSLNHNEKDVPRYLYLPAQDNEFFNISQYFEASSSFIEQSRRHTNVLVHCVAGVSRSATIVAAYIINKYGYSAQAAIALIQKRRKKVAPNKGFRLQLQKISPSKMAKRRQEDEETVSSPQKLEMTQSVSLARPTGFDKTQKVQRLSAERQSNQLLLTFNHSSTTKKQRRKTECEPSRQKIVSKIEKIKATLISNLANSSQFDHQSHHNQRQTITLTTLLQSKIYQNKLKTRI